MSKRKCWFNVNLQQEYNFYFLNNTNNEGAYYTLCTGEFSVVHKGKGGIEDNVKTAKGRSAIIATE